MTKALGRIAARVAAVATLGAVLAAVTVLVLVPRAIHGTAMTVLTGSMAPTIPVGSVIIDEPVDPRTLHVGDVATYQVAPGNALYITHRIIKIDNAKTPALFTFKGDANNGPDMHPIPATAVRAKVLFHVPYLGAIRDLLHTRSGLSGIGMLLLIGYALAQLVGWNRDRRLKRETDQSPPASGPVVQMLLVTLAPHIHGSIPGLASFAGPIGHVVVGEDSPITYVLCGRPDELDAAEHNLATLEPLAMQRSDLLELPAMWVAATHSTGRASEMASTHAA